MDRVEGLFGLSEGQTQMLDTLGVLLEGNNIGDDFFLAIIAAHDKLEFDAYGRAPLGWRGGYMMRVILPGFVDYPQHLHALS